jgi:hypothetical protein
MMTTGLRILAMDTEYLIAIDLERVMRKSQSTDIDVSTQLEFPKFLKENIYSLIVCDLDILVQAGLLETFLQNRNGAAVVFTTTSFNPMRYKSQSGQWPVISKPFLDETLLCAIASSTEIANSMCQRANAVDLPLSNSKCARGRMG